MKVLIVDDLEESRILLSDLLASQGYQMLQADDGETALEIVRREHPQMVISDILMSRMDGFELCRRIKTSPDLKDIAFVFYSASFIEQEDERLALDLGASSFIRKPADPSEFLAVIESLLVQQHAGMLPVPDRPAGDSGELDLRHKQSLTNKLNQKIQQLESSRRSFSNLIANLPGMVYRCHNDANWTMEFVSDGCHQLTGYSQEDLIGNHRIAFMQLIHPDDREKIQLSVRLACQTDESYLFECRIQQKDGSLVWVWGQGRCFNPGTAEERLEGYIADVSNQRRAEMERKRFFELSVDMLCIAGMDGYFKQLNLSWTRNLGWSEAEILARPWIELVHPEDRQPTELAGSKLVDGQQVYAFENRYRHKDGSYRWLSWNSIPIPAEEVMFCVARDITEQKQLELTRSLQARRTQAQLEFPRIVDQLNEAELMQRGQELAEELTDSKSAFIHFIDVDGTNNARVAWSHRTLESCCKEVFNGYEPDIQADLCAESLRQGKPVVINDRANATDLPDQPEPHTSLQRLISVPVVENERVVMVAGVLNKETAYSEFDVETVQLIANETWTHIQHQQTLKQLLKLSQAVEQSPESIAITDLGGKLEYVNQTFLKSTGYSREALIGRNPRVLQSGKTPVSTYESMWKTITQGKAWEGEFINRRRDGSEYVELAHVSPIRQPDGQVVNYLAIKEDITDKKRMSEELDLYREDLEKRVEERTQALREALVLAEAATEAKAAFLANMSHEIRTPMNAIVGMTHLLQKDAVTPEQKVRLKKIEGSGRHLMGLINNILDLTKIDAGKLALEQTDFVLATLPGKVVSMLADQAKTKNLRIIVETEPLSIILRGDVTRLTQVLLNLAGNAIKFTDQGSVTLRTQVVEENARDVVLRFEVADTGIGIEPEVMARLFSVFEQADASTTRRFGGTGLGLAISKRLVELMGGEIGVDSIPAVGSTFWFTVRMKKSDQLMSPATSLLQQQNAAATLKSHYQGARLLLVEDEPINQEIGMELLRSVGLAPDSADNGLEAIEKMRQGNYELVLMDMQMPRMDGLEAARKILEQPRHAQVPILAMTANASPEDRERCIEAGMKDFIAKPVDPEALFAMLLKWLPRRPRVKVPVAGDETTPGSMADAENAVNLRENLRQIEGLDLDQGLGSVLGDEPMLARLLCQFVEYHGQDMSVIGEDPAQIQQRAHSMKGSAATLGLNQLSQSAAALESAVKDGRSQAELTSLQNDCNTQLMALQSNLSRLGFSLDSFG